VRDGWYTAMECSAILGVSRQTTVKWIESGELQARPRNGNKPKHGRGQATWRIEEKDLARFIRAHASELTGRNVDLFTIVELLAGNLTPLPPGENKK